MIRRINAEFVPVYISPLYSRIGRPNSAEGRVFAGLYRSTAVGQGICVVNADGRALMWAVSMQDEKRSLAFLDHGLKLFREPPKSNTTQRFMDYPGQRLEDAREESSSGTPIPERHPDSETCPSMMLRWRQPTGTVMALTYGRAFAGGKPAADTQRQSSYIEDRFYVAPSLQEAVAGALAGATTDAFTLPDELGRLCAEYAYLGFIDRCPTVDEAPSADTIHDVSARFSGRKSAAGLIRVEGTSQRKRAIGDKYLHEVKLTWEGYIALDGKRIRRLLLIARGSERMKWEKSDAIPFGPGDSTSDVCYGIAGELLPLDRLVQSGDVADGIDAKMQKLTAAVERRRKEGKDTAAISAIIQEFQRLMQDGKFKEAEARLDEALKACDK